MYGYDWNIDADAYEDFTKSRDEMERGCTDATHHRSFETILGAQVYDLETDPDAMLRLFD